MNSVNIISLSFNNDLTRFSCCTTTGVRVFQLEPLKARERINRGGALSCKIMKFQCLFAIVHSSKYSDYSEKTVMIFNNMKKDFEKTIEYKSVVKSVRTSRNKIIVVTLNEIFVYTFPVILNNIRKLLTLGTCPNPMGLCEVTPLETSTQQIIAYPGSYIGTIDILDISCLKRRGHVNSGRIDTIYGAYIGEISGLAINKLGTLIASAASEEMYIKIWDTCRKIKVAEVRRADIATIYCINFSPNSEFICCSGVEGTIEIFAVIKFDINTHVSPEPYSAYVVSEHCQIPKSIAIFSIPSKVGCICTFLTLNTVAVIGLDGVYYKFEYSDDGYGRIKETQMLM
ncbi:WD repeat domain phosphoinositide-interacting protein 4-like [Myzus persicae]|uniref:WD repeat domain phosphoinositide-interacting protein 4-like n=1 Tax=Myzus persicae TaxID=13164 RepID=UPI000B937BE1|nr:WD repeat domain phosphoinositide-interacting protein 4-like [Myzus persicae]XP_022171309.1 WD repeat domain phosphoinositide-interacting protein 4-like [Myzus persicae]